MAPSIEKWFEPWYNKYAVMVLSAAAGLGFYEAVPWSDLKSADWAAWMQAVGSIIAIFGAFAIGKHQADIQMRVAEQARQAAISDRHSTIKGVLDNVFQICLNIEANLAKQAPSRTYPFVFLYIKASIPPAQRLLDDIPIYELGSGELVHAIFDMKNAVRGILSIAKLHKQQVGAQTEEDAFRPDEAAEWLKQKLEMARTAYTAAVTVTGGTPRSAPERFP